MRPIVIVNFKTYEQATGIAAVELAQACEHAGQEHDAHMIVAPQAVDLHHVSQSAQPDVYAQHADPQGPGTHTGWQSILALKQAGAVGCFLNHSEHPLDDDTIVRTMEHLSKHEIKSIVFAADVETLRRLKDRVTPTYFCIEPPELISGDVSVSSAKPELIKHAVEATDTPVLVGAGVKSFEDCRVALDLGAHGIVLASGVILQEDRLAAFKKLLSPPGP